MSEKQGNEHVSGSKPVNINISFNINPKNILSGVMPIQKQTHNQYSQLKGRKISKDQILPPKKHFIANQPPKTPELVQTDRNVYKKQFDSSRPIEDSKKKKSRKRNSVDHDFLREHSFKQSESERSSKPHKKIQNPSAHGRKRSTKSKGSQWMKSKRSASKHTDDAWKSVGKTMGLENNAIKSASMDYNTERKILSQNFLKSPFNKTPTNEMLKGIVPQTVTNKVKHFVQLRKKSRKKSGKINKSQIVLNQEKGKDIDELNRKKIIQKLTSLRSITGSVFQTQIQDEENGKKEEKSLVIHTEQSLAFIDEIHQYQLQKMYYDMDEKKDDFVENNVTETQNLISTYIAILQEQVDVDGQQSSLSELPIQEQFENYRKKQKREEEQKSQKAEREEKKQRYMQLQDREQEIRPFCSSEMTKEQSLFNELQRIKLNQLKKHQIQKWGQLLVFIKKSLNKGALTTEQILQNVYSFLEKTKEDLQNEVNSSRKTTTKDHLDEFTNKLSSKNQNQKQEQKIEERKFQIQSISSMSFQEKEGEEDEQLKLMNLETIEHALKQRYESLLDRQERQIQVLEEQRDQGKINEIDFIIQKQKIQKWIKNETNQILKAKRNIWKGYNEAKGILEKTAKSKYFEEGESSGKKKSMMKCLSENYLLKTNFKKLFNKEEFSSSSESAEKSLEKQKQDENLLQNNDENEMQRIKQRLLDIKQKHLQEVAKDDSLEDQSPNISYEEVEKQLQESYSEEQMNIIRNQIPQQNYKGTSLPSQEDKLRYMCAEDKEDIFEFIFLDLCIQLYQQPCHQNVIMESISNHVSRVRRQATKKKGVRTNLNVVKEYLKRFINFIYRTHKNVLKTIDEPLGPTALEMLKYMHENDEQNHEEEENVSTLIIPISIFDQFQKTFLPSVQFQTYYELDEEKEQKRIDFLKNILHIHNKAIFDSLNEFLDQLRPFGIWGKPFPWKKSSIFLHMSDEAEKQAKMKKASDKVIEYCSYVCGLLVDKEESLVGNAKLSQDYVQQIKEDRLSRMLANELVENEERWLFYDDEETEVLVEVSNHIFLMMMKEASYDIKLVL